MKTGAAPPLTGAAPVLHLPDAFLKGAQDTARACSAQPVVTLYRIEPEGIVTILAVRHQREEDYH